MVQTWTETDRKKKPHPGVSNPRQGFLGPRHSRQTGENATATIDQAEIDYMLLLPSEHVKPYTWFFPEFVAATDRNWQVNREHGMWFDTFPSLSQDKLHRVLGR